MSQIRKKKTLQELELCDAFLFAATMEDEEICRQVLERILDIPISHVTVRSENPIVLNPDNRSVRLDVYAADEDGTMYDIEMQTARKKSQLPKRARFYHSQLDATALKPGDNFEKLPKSYVIFICTFDPFQEGLLRYSFENQCIETNQKLGDETRKIFLNTKGIQDGTVSAELQHFLHFVENSNVAAESNDFLLTKLHDRIIHLKNNRRLEGNYMLFAELLDDERKDGFNDGFNNGFIEGQQDGQSKSNKHWSLLLSKLTPEDLVSLKKDSALISDMFTKYNI
ncbi:MAG: Rpn family recombination-promoting nuclease/putative transposase [Lachnospiraceae bacterium]